MVPRCVRHDLLRDTLRMMPASDAPLSFDPGTVCGTQFDLPNTRSRRTDTWTFVAESHVIHVPPLMCPRRAKALPHDKTQWKGTTDY